MGPIETEIRDIGNSPRKWVEYWVFASSCTSFLVLSDAAHALGFVDRFNPAMGCVSDAERAGAWPDVLSEAIEAAEALGL